jgi:transcriptional regulator with XRE-family HTH domain
MFKEARNQAGISRDEAAFRLHIGSRTLTNYEHRVTVTPPEIALKMQEIYRVPTLTARYCSEYCPIGQVFAHSVPEHDNLCQSVLGLLDEHSDVTELRETLTKIAADGVIDQNEKPIFETIMNELLDLEMKIKELKLQAARIVSIPDMMQRKKKRPLQAAR